eukprot:m.272124 g.272124  ORF g.272124 m.272124 type:complete len:153 (+) comp54792_c1_seq8:1828-2286(+)
MVTASNSSCYYQRTRVPALKVLLQYGALITLKNKDGKTAKDLVKFYRTEVTALLQEHEDYLAELGQTVKPASRALEAPHETAAEVVPQGFVLRLDDIDADVPPLCAEEYLIDNGPVGSPPDLGTMTAAVRFEVHFSACALLFRAVVDDGLIA